MDSSSPRQDIRDLCMLDGEPIRLFNFDHDDSWETAIEISADSPFGDDNNPFLHDDPWGPALDLPERPTPDLLIQLAEQHLDHWGLLPYEQSEKELLEALTPEPRVAHRPLHCPPAPKFPERLTPRALIVAGNRANSRELKEAEYMASHNEIKTQAIAQLHREVNAIAPGQWAERVKHSKWTFWPKSRSVHLLHAAVGVLREIEAEQKNKNQSVHVSVLKKDPFTINALQPHSLFRRQPWAVARSDLDRAACFLYADSSLSQPDEGPWLYYLTNGEGKITASERAVKREIKDASDYRKFFTDAATRSQQQTQPVAVFYQESTVQHYKTTTEKKRKENCDMGLDLTETDPHTGKRRKLFEKVDWNAELAQLLRGAPLGERPNGA